MSIKIAKLVARRYMGRFTRRSRTASCDRAPAQVLPKPCTVVSEVWLRDFPGVGAWQDDYDPEIDNEPVISTNPVRLQLRLTTGETLHKTVHVGCSLESGRFEVIRTSGYEDEDGLFPQIGHSIDVITGWLGSDEYSERSVYLENAHIGGRWTSSTDMNTRCRVLSKIIGGNIGRL